MGDRSEGPRPTVHNVLYTFPMTHAQIVEAFRAKIQEIKQTHHDRSFSILPQDTEYAKQANRFVAVIDSITSVPGVLLPWKEMVKVCKEEGIWSVIDAAHSIGQEVGHELGLYFNDLFYDSRPTLTWA